jgi:isoleucyl-tRNA synthetase
MEKEMLYTHHVVNLGRSLRKENKLKVRQPLSKVFVISEQKDVIEALKLQQNLICEELNVKQILLDTNESKFVHYNIKPNYKVLGKKVGKFMNSSKTAIESLQKEDYDKIINGEDVFILLGDQKYKLEQEDVILDRVVQEGLIAIYEKGITVALDTHITLELELEAIARELINRINSMRKAKEFEVTDRIDIEISTTEKLEKALQNHGAFVKHETLVENLIFSLPKDGEEIELNGEEVVMQITKSLPSSKH